MKIFFNKLIKCKNNNDLCNLYTNEQLEKMAFINIIIFISFYFIIFILKFFLNRADLSCTWLSFIYLISIISFINYYIYYNKNKIKKTSNIILIIYIIWAFITCLFSTNKFKSFFGESYMQEGLFTYISYLFLFLNSTIILKKEYLLKILKLFSYLGLFLSIFVLINNYLKIDYYHIIEFRPFTSIFYNENHSAYFFMMTYICSTMLYYFNDKKNRYINLIISIIILHNLILNNCLGCYLSSILCIILLLIYTIMKRKNIIKILTIILIFISLSLIDKSTVTYNFKTSSSDIQEIKTALKNNDYSQIDTVGTNRLGLWKYGIKFIGEKPIFGYGIESLKEQYEKVNIPEKTSRPHNEFIQIAAFMGIPALIIYILFLLSIFIPILKNLKKVDNIMVIITLISISYLTSSFVGISVFYTTPFLFIFLGLINNKITNSINN